MYRKFWMYLNVKDEQTSQLQNEIAAFVPDDWFRETNSHVSIISGLGIPESNAEECLTELEQIAESISIQTLTIEDFHFYPALSASEQTYVVSLQPQIDLSSIQETVVSCVQKHNGEILYDYKDVTPHITLFKSGDSVDYSKTALEYTKDEFIDIVKHTNVYPFDPVQVVDVQVEEF